MSLALHTIPEPRRRYLRSVRPSGPMSITVDGAEYINFSSNDYFGLSQHPEVKAVAAEALANYGAGAGASRLVTGSHPLYAPLEARLAEMKQSEAALVFGSGYLANIGVISSLAGRHDLILADKLVHACMLDGATLSGAKLLRFQHNNLADLQRLLEKRTENKRCFVLTETLFSMDGDRAPIQEMLALCRQHDAVLISDDAHGLGIVEHYPDSSHIQIGTLSKAAGAYGGYVCASQEVVDYLVNHARSFIFTTALPPATVAAADKAVELLANDESLNERLFDNIILFNSILEGNLNVANEQIMSPIQPIITGSGGAALAAQGALATQGFWVQAIRPPTVPEGTSRLRVTLSAAHRSEDVERLAEAMGELIA